MTIYEQIQRALNYLEENLLNQINQKLVAKESGMSSRKFQQYFWMVTGYSYKEYLIKRRLNIALQYLKSTNKQILTIALDIGYQNHESFTRAFKNEFNVSPQQFRKHRLHLNGLNKIELFKEKYMGAILKELPELWVVSFDGFAPEPENKAKEKLEKWRKKHPTTQRPRRVFGYNIDLQGKVDYNPNNVGYKFLITINDATEADGEKIETIQPGKFLVTGIEGNFIDDPAGNFIRDGWAKMNKLIQEKGYSMKKNCRWFEEELEPQKPGNLRLDLYVEIE